MTPYATFSYFGFLLYPALPALGLGIWGRLSRWFVLGATLFMLALQYGALLDLESGVTIRQFWLLVGYVLWQGGLVWILTRWRGRPRVFQWVLGLSLLPLVAVKVLFAFGLRGWGFLGISYLTFRTLDVLFGVKDRVIKEISFPAYGAYLLFFPTIASGPIDRYRRFVKDWQHVRTREEYLTDLDHAVQRIFRGFLYKFLIAWAIKKFWLDPAGLAHGFWPVVSYMYAYSFYLFFDFAGYSAFAIGVSYLFGIHSPENFDRPFLSQNIRDFWNRWHISLSHWFRDHVYMRFVMAATRAKWHLDKYVISYLGFALSMGLMGVWHGLQWHYIVYGLYHAGLIVGFDYLSRWNKTHKVWGTGPLWRWLGVLVTFQVVCFGLLIFSGRLF